MPPGSRFDEDARFSDREVWLRNLLGKKGLPFRDFVAAVLYDRRFGYYATPKNPVGRGGDYVTSPHISPVFGWSIARLADEFLARFEDVVCSIVDVGCGDGALIRSIAENLSHRGRKFRAFGVDRNLGRAQPSPLATYLEDLEEAPSDAPVLIVSNELYDAFPFARVVQRDSGLHELWVVAREKDLDWDEHPASADLLRYFEERKIALEVGQFADVTPEWEAGHAATLGRFAAALVVTFDYGFEQEKLFHPRFRRYGTAGAYSGQQVSRDLLAKPGEQDLTAHVNFTDLMRAGAQNGYEMMFWGRQAGFLVALGALEHPLFRSVEDLQVDSMSEVPDLLDRRESAQRLVLPDGIGQEIRVLVQGKGVPATGWSFQRDPFRR